MTGRGGPRVAMRCLALVALFLGSGCERTAAAPPTAEEAPMRLSAPPVAKGGPDPGDTYSDAALIITADGYGPLRIGMTLADVVAILGPDSDPEAIGGLEPETCDQFRPVQAPVGLLVMIEEGRLTRISLHGESSIATDRGLRLGAAAADVRAAYGPTIAAEPHHYQDPPAEYLTSWARGGLGAQGIAEPGSRGIRYEIGQEDGRVETIHAGGPSIQYVEGCL